VNTLLTGGDGGGGDMMMSSSGHNNSKHNSWVLIAIGIHIYQRQNQLAKIIHQQTAMKYKLHDGNTLLYCRYKTELVLEAANLIVYRDRSTITNKMVDFNRPDMVLINRQKKTALVIDTTVPFTP
jgi:hypothetical protein